MSIQFHSLHQLQLHLGPLDSMALAVFLHSLVYLVHEEQGMPVPNDVGNFLMSSTDSLEWYSMGDFILVTLILIT